MHRTRSILAALAAVALSATAVFAAASVPPKAVEDGPATANSASGQARPVRAEGSDAMTAAKSPEASESPEPSESPEASESPDAAKSPKAAESPDVDATTGTGAPHPDNHGKTVSEAAHATTPAGFANHGAYVSFIAKRNHGHGKPPVTKPVTAQVPTPTPAPTTH